MIARSHPLFCLCLVLAACDKPSKPADSPDQQVAALRETRATRPPKPSPPQSREQLREQMQSARAIALPEERNQALAAALWEALELDPDLAREGFEQLTAGSAEKNRLIQHFAMRLAEQNVEAAQQWAAALATDEEKSLAFGHIALVLASKDPERAAKLLSDAGVSGHDFNVALVQVVQRWAAAAPAAAAAWVSVFEAGEVRREALRTVVAAWAANDPQAAMAWITALQDPPLRQEAVLGMAMALSEQAPSRQAEWLRVAPPEIRAEIEILRAAGPAPK
ncbi:MAG: hypothetical protein WCO57_06510 [Verrucomicrobiota bacterium]